MSDCRFNRRIQLTGVSNGRTQVIPAVQLAKTFIVLPCRNTVMCANLPVMQSKTQVLQYLLIFRIANQIVIFHGVKVQVKQEFPRLALFTPPGLYQKC